MYTSAYDTLDVMRAPLPRLPRLPSPESLGGPRLASRQVVTFRLHDADHDALLTLSERASLGPSAFARRIVEAYIRAQAVTKTTRNTSKTRKGTR
jgi:hypothetical protein